MQLLAAMQLLAPLQHPCQHPCNRSGVFVVYISGMQMLDVTLQQQIAMDQAVLACTCITIRHS